MFFSTILGLATFGYVSGPSARTMQPKPRQVVGRSRARGRTVRPVMAELGKEHRAVEARSRHAPGTAIFSGKDENKGVRRGPDPLHFRTDDAPEIPADVLPSAREVKKMQLFRRNASAYNNFLDWKSGVRQGPRPDLVYASSLPGGTAQKMTPHFLVPGMTVGEFADEARDAWGWDAEDRLKVHLLGKELHPAWRLDECGVMDLCSLQIARRRPPVSHPLTDL